MDFSPEISNANFTQAEQRLVSYAAGKDIFCKYNTGPFKGIFCLRLVGGVHSHKTLSLLKGDNAVMAVCAGHEKTFSRITWNGWIPSLSSALDSKNPGSITMLLRNGSVRSVSPKAPYEMWSVDRGGFYPPSKGGAPNNMFYLYGFEPNPPQFER